MEPEELLSDGDGGSDEEDLAFDSQGKRHSRSPEHSLAAVSEQYVVVHISIY